MLEYFKTVFVNVIFNFRNEKSSKFYIEIRCHTLFSLWNMNFELSEVKFTFLTKNEEYF